MGSLFIKSNVDGITNSSFYSATTSYELLHRRLISRKANSNNEDIDTLIINNNDDVNNKNYEIDMEISYTAHETDSLL
jgi:hypothetical protein